jgi:hypothetical protein
MQKVIHLTVVPGTKRRKELFILSIAPGTSNHIAARAQVETSLLSAKRDADFLILKDAEIQVAGSWLDRLAAWLMPDAFRKAIK